MSAKPMRSMSKGNGRQPSLADEGLVFLDSSLQPIALDEGAAWIFGSHGEPAPNEYSPDLHLTLPEEILEGLRSQNAGDVSTAKMRIRAGNCGYNCRIFVMEPLSGVNCEPRLALHLQRDSCVNDAVDLLAARYHLTDREQEALKAIATGLTSKETAEQMNISPNTVKSFLRIIMIKMGVGSRAAIVGKLLEYSHSQNGSRPAAP